MSATAGNEVIMGIARAVAPKFFDEGYERLYIAECCKRIVISPTPVERCRTCDRRPLGFWITQEALR